MNIKFEFKNFVAKDFRSSNTKINVNASINQAIERTNTGTHTHTFNRIQQERRNERTNVQRKLMPLETYFYLKKNFSYQKENVSLCYNKEEKKINYVS